MKNTKLWILAIVMMAIILPIVSAEDFVQLNDTFTIDVGITSSGGWFSVAGIDVSIFEPETRNLIVNNQPMTMLSTGQYYYNFVPNLTGVYYYAFNINNGTDVVFEGAGTFTSMPDIAQETVVEFDNMLTVFILFSVGLLLAILGEYIGNYLFTILAGVWFLGNTLQMVFEGQGFTSYLFFALAGVALIYHGVIRIAEERDKQHRANIKKMTGEDTDAE